MKVIKLTLNKKEYKCTLGLGFLGDIIDVLDLDYESFLSKYQKNPIKYVSLCAYHCIKWELEEGGEEIDFTLKQMRGWIDNEGGLKNEAMKKFSEAFMNSILKDFVDDDGKDVSESPKKK